jgi:hypothetical protein
MNIVPLGPGFAAELRDVTIVEVASEIPPMLQCAQRLRNIRYSSFVAKR